jgi:hypothetical protein
MGTARRYPGQDVYTPEGYLKLVINAGEVTVKGGYRPEVIRVRQGVPVEPTFDRQESGDCTSLVVFPDFRASAALPAPRPGPARRNW